jgi:hypothetical protein
VEVAEAAVEAMRALTSPKTSKAAPEALRRLTGVSPRHRSNDRAQARSLRPLARLFWTAVSVVASAFCIAICQVLNASLFLCLRLSDRTHALRIGCWSQHRPNDNSKRKERCDAKERAKEHTCYKSARAARGRRERRKRKLLRQGRPRTLEGELLFTRTLRSRS